MGEIIQTKGDGVGDDLMLQCTDVSILNSGNSDNEYLIKDKSGITVGRFEIVEIDEVNKKCNIKFRFYRTEEKELLDRTLKLLLKATFKNIKINKVNIFMKDNVNVGVFLNNGFALEGIFIDNIHSQGEYKNEISMGITRADYNSTTRVSLIDLKVRDVSVRILTSGDSTEILDYYIRNKEHLEAFEPSRDRPFYTLQVQHNILNESYRQYLKGTALDFGIFKDDKLIGKIKLSNIVYGIFRNGIIGYSIDKDYQGRGYMRAAVDAVVGYAFEELELHRIEASALVDNERSKKVLLSCGFNVLGINEKYLFINGKWRDHITLYKIK